MLTSGHFPSNNQKPEQTRIADYSIDYSLKGQNPNSHLSYYGHMDVTYRTASCSDATTPFSGQVEMAYMGRGYP